MLKVAGPLSLGFMLLSSHVLSCTDGRGFLPENSLRIPVSEKNTGLTETQYNAVIDKVVTVFDPIVKKYGGLLRVDRKWESEIVNAGTYRDEGGYHWHLAMYGGFARHPAITEDGFALVICHEIGHHIGGAPKKVYNSKPMWASTEGQSDYFATLKCLRKVFAGDDNEAIIKDLEVPKDVTSACGKSFSTDWEQAICIRTSMAGLSVAKVNADSRRVPSPGFHTFDPKTVTTTVNHHPEPQCRLDTYFAGSVCEVPSTRYVSQVDEARATCHKKLGFETGLRPLCWYKPIE